MDKQTPERPWWRIALVTVPLIVGIGSAIGYLSNSGYSNEWFARLDKPAFMPPSWVFGAVWTTLYTLMAVALAMVLTLPDSPQRRAALTLFGVQLALNYGWSPFFFAGRMIDVALLLILALLLAAAGTANLFRRSRPLAGWLLVPYLLWLCLATALNYEVGRLNPGADAAPLGITGA